MPKVEDASIWLRWAVDPVSALRVLILPPLLALPTHFLLPLLLPHLPLPLQALGNAFTPFFLLSLPPLRSASRQRSLFPMLARRWGIRKAGKAARFGEQGYAVVGVWGVRTLTNSLTSHLPPLPHSLLANPPLLHRLLYPQPPQRTLLDRLPAQPSARPDEEVLFEPDRVLVAAGAAIVFWKFNLGGSNVRPSTGG
ncbi:hypothetical protein B0H13DRAFT_1898293 [Mycena leptocephala]|nr:hypothetical protein B0H13DRAFT_1898293 [Mycena leptocephala]